MRSVYTRILTAGLLVLAASPAFAQPGPFGRMMQAPTAALLLRDEKVQEELKLTDDQKAAFVKIADKYKDDFQKARTDMDFKKIGELMKAASEEVDKVVPTVLKADQIKRLNQLEVQAASLDAFTKDDVAAALKLTDKQKKDIDEAKAEFDKDRQELFKDAPRGDQEKMAELFKKSQAMRKDAFDKVVTTLSDDQKKTWKDLTGDKFEFSPMRRPGGNPPPDKPKDK